MHSYTHQYCGEGDLFLKCAGMCVILAADSVNKDNREKKLFYNDNYVANSTISSANKIIPRTRWSSVATLAASAHIIRH